MLLGLHHKVLALLVFTALLAFPVASEFLLRASVAGTPGADAAFSVNPSEMQWQKMEPQLGDASPERALLHEDPVTHASQFLIRLPKNFHVPAHWHSVNETHTVVSGQFIVQIDGKPVLLGPGGFNYTPGRVVHQTATPPASGALILVTVDGPYDLNVGDPNGNQNQP